ETVVPCSTLPSLFVFPASKSSASTSDVFPTPRWPATAMLRIFVGSVAGIGGVSSSVASSTHRIPVSVLRSDRARSPRCAPSARRRRLCRRRRQPALPPRGRQRDRLHGGRASLVRRAEAEHLQLGSNRPAVALATPDRAEAGPYGTRKPVQLAA